MRLTCRICKNEKNNQTYMVKEMLLGTRDEFRYFRCGECGCLQIDNPPNDLGRYYPSNYFSFDNLDFLAKNKLRKFIDTRRVRYHLTGQNFIGFLASKVAKPLDYLQWMPDAGVNLDSTILDVGCGSGRLLVRMWLGGFSHGMGIDPFIDKDLTYPGGVKILKAAIQEIVDGHARQFDLIMFHNSFEHMENPNEILGATRSLLKKGGKVLIQIPLSDSFAWEKYKENWYNLDAPRHFYLHTRQSMHMLAQSNGFAIKKINCNSYYSQFTASELYKRGIPASADKKDKTIFSRKEIVEYQNLTHKLNAQGKGDAAAFYLHADQD